MEIIQKTTSFVHMIKDGNFAETEEFEKIEKLTWNKCVSKRSPAEKECFKKIHTSWKKYEEIIEIALRVHSEETKLAFEERDRIIDTANKEYSEKVQKDFWELVKQKKYTVNNLKIKREKN